MKAKLLDGFNIEEMGKCLNEGGVIAFPTDTVFGLACIYDDEKAIERVKMIKGRDANKPLPMMCDGKDMLKKVAYTTPNIEKVIDRFTPGALTLILNKKETVLDYVTNGFKTIGIRIPDHKDILDLIRYLNKPILVTSCNISHEPSIKAYKEILDKFSDKVDMIVCEDAQSSLASTIIDVTGDIKVIREGIIKEDELKEVYYA